MRIRWTQGKQAGVEEEVDKATAESALDFGIAELVDCAHHSARNTPAETEAVEPPENAAVRTGRSAPKRPKRDS